MTWHALATFAAALFTITNPIGNAALFIGMVGERPPAERRRAALTCGVAIAVILVVVTWIGEGILQFFGVSVPALEATGGLIIAMIGISMLHARPSAIHSSADERTEAQAKDSVAIVPLAMPIVAGPGAIATVIVNTHKYAGFSSNLAISLVCIAAAATVAVCFLAAGPMARFLGSSGLSILTRFMGLILTAIAIGMLASGLSGLMPGLAGGHA